MSQKGQGLAAAEDGSMALEFALVAPVLLLLAGAIIDIASAANRQIQLVGAVRAGAQLAVARPPTPATLHEIETAVRGIAPEVRGDDTQAVVVELFCEASDGAWTACGVNPAGEATYVSIAFTESWAPTLTYSLLRQAVPLAARQIIRVR